MYDFLIGHPDRATEIAVVATKTQDDSAQRLDALPPPPDSSPPPGPSDVGQESSSDLNLGKAGSARKNRKDRKDPKKRRRALVVAAADADPAAGAGTALEIGSPRWNRRADESNLFTRIYDVHHGTGVKLGPAITISALLI